MNYNLYLKIHFNRNSNCLITTRSSKQTVLILISALLGSVFGLMGSIGGAMNFTEEKLNKYKAREEGIRSKENIALGSEVLKSNIGTKPQLKKTLDHDTPYKGFKDDELCELDLYNFRRQSLADSKITNQ